MCDYILMIEFIFPIAEGRGVVDAISSTVNAIRKTSSNSGLS